MKTLSILIIAILLSGCAIPTVIKSNPEGATVYIENVEMGKTPLTYSDKEIILSQKNIRLEMNGYKSFSSVIKKDKLKVGPLVGACFVGVPALWMLGYEEEYTFELDRGHASAARGKSATTRSTSENQPKAKSNPPQTIQPVEKRIEPASSSVSHQNTATSSASMIVTGNKAKIRKKPSTKAAIVKTLKKGEVVQVIKQSDDWFQVELASGDVGWCHKSVLERRN